MRKIQEVRALYHFVQDYYSETPVNVEIGEFNAFRKSYTIVVYETTTELDNYDEIIKYSNELGLYCEEVSTVYSYSDMHYFDAIYEVCIL